MNKETFMKLGSEIAKRVMNDDAEVKYSIVADDNSLLLSLTKQKLVSRYEITGNIEDIKNGTIYTYADKIVIDKFISAIRMVHIRLYVGDTCCGCGSMTYEDIEQCI